MAKATKAKKPKPGRTPMSQSERMQRSGKPSPFKSTYKRKKKVPV